MGLWVTCASVSQTHTQTAAGHDAHQGLAVGREEGVELEACCGGCTAAHSDGAVPDCLEVHGGVSLAALLAALECVALHNLEWGGVQLEWVCPPLPLPLTSGMCCWIQA